MSSHSPAEGVGRTRRQILVVEDNSADVLMIREAIETAEVEADLHVVEDGQAATEYFDATERDASTPCPDLVLLDLNLPRKSGAEVLKHLRTCVRSKHTLVLIVSSSDAPRDKASVQDLGVAGYFRKPSDYDEFLRLGPLVKSLLDRLDTGHA